MSGDLALVTGATGFVGGYLVRRLVASGERVRALVRSTSKVESLKNLCVELFTGDLEDFASLRAAVRGVQSVFHLGEIRIRVKDSDRKNIAAVRELAAEAGRQPNFRRFVFLSALTVAAVPEKLPADEETLVDGKKTVDDYHTRCKRGSEQALIKSGAPTSIVRAGAIYGPGAAYLPQLVRMCRKLKLPLPYPGDPDMHFASIHAEDLAAVLESASRYKGHSCRVFHAVDDGRATARQFVEATLGTAGVRLRLFKMPLFIQRAGAAVFDPFFALRLSGKNLRAIVLYQGFNQDFSNRRIKEELGVILKHPTWATGMTDTVEWLRRQFAGQ